MMTAQTRYSLTAQFLRGGAIFARHAHEIEKNADPSTPEESQAEHRAYVVGAVMQAVAALEAEITEILIHGPGHHLGSNGIDVTARDFLAPLVKIVDRRPCLEKYHFVLHSLRKPPLACGKNPHQAARLLIDLRDELVHYKSKWGDQRFSSELRSLKFEKPGFVSEYAHFFPQQCLSASLASWAVITGVEFINAFYKNLAISSPLTAYAERLWVPPAKTR